MFPSGQQASEACAQSHVRLPTEGLDRLWALLQPEWQVATDVGGIARGPGTFDQCATGLRIPGLGEGTLAAALTAGSFRGEEPQEVHQLSGMIEARQGAECRHSGHRHGERDATQGRERFDDRR